MSKYGEGLIETEQLILAGRELTENTILLLKKQEHEYLIARIGLQGTLWCAIGCLIVVILIVVSPMFITHNIIDGWQVVAIVIAMVVSIVFYGTFIFKRALNASGQPGGAMITVAAQQIVDRLEGIHPASQERPTPAESQTRP